MAFWDRVSRLLSSFKQERLDERMLVGVQGEEYSTEVIASTNPQCHVPNAIVPSTHPAGRVRETDHVVLVGGTVFVVEVKNYKGRLLWEGNNTGGLLQVKTGRYGESIEPKKAKNPLLQAWSYIYPFKQYLGRFADPRFERLRVEPVGAFTRAGDITAIHSLEEGRVYVDELPAFFALQRNEQFAHRPSGWIVNGLESLPRLDVVRTKGGHLFRGFLENPGLEYRAPDRNHHHWEWREIAWIYIEPSGFFSSHDKLRIQLQSGQSVESSAVRGTVRILDLEGQRTEHALSKLGIHRALARSELVAGAEKHEYRGMEVVSQCEGTIGKTGSHAIEDTLSLTASWPERAEVPSSYIGGPRRPRQDSSKGSQPPIYPPNYKDRNLADYRAAFFCSLLCPVGPSDRVPQRTKNTKLTMIRVRNATAAQQHLAGACTS